jgi:hypothetical protein
MKKVWEWVKLIGLAILGVLATIFVVKKVRQAFLGLISGEGDKWDAVPGTRNILVQPKGGEPIEVELPDKVFADDIRAVKLASPGGEVIVEVIHASKDRRSAIGDGSAAARLRSKSDNS